MKKIIALVLVLALICTLAAGCGAKEESSIAGEWSLTSVSASGAEMSVEDFSAAVGQDVSGICYSISEDGTLVFAASADIQEEGTWTINDDGSYTFTTPTSEMTGTLEDGRLCVESMGALLIFTQD